MDGHITAARCIQAAYSECRSAAIYLVWHPTNVTGSENKILELSRKVISLQESPEFDAAVQDLRGAIHEHLTGVRDKVAALEFLIAKESDKAA